MRRISRIKDKFDTEICKLCKSKNIKIDAVTDEQLSGIVKDLQCEKLSSLLNIDRLRREFREIAKKEGLDLKNIKDNDLKLNYNDLTFAIKFSANICVDKNGCVFNQLITDDNELNNIINIINNLDVDNEANYDAIIYWIAQSCLDEYNSDNNNKTYNLFSKLIKCFDEKNNGKQISLEYNTLENIFFSISKQNDIFKIVSNQQSYQTVLELLDRMPKKDLSYDNESCPCYYFLKGILYDLQQQDKKSKLVFNQAIDLLRRFKIAGLINILAYNMDDDKQGRTRANLLKLLKETLPYDDFANNFNGFMKKLKDVKDQNTDEYKEKVFAISLYLLSSDNPIKIKYDDLNIILNICQDINQGEDSGAYALNLFGNVIQEPISIEQFESFIKKFGNYSLEQIILADKKNKSTDKVKNYLVESLKYKVAYDNFNGLLAGKIDALKLKLNNNKDSCQADILCIGLLILSSENCCSYKNVIDFLNIYAKDKKLSPYELNLFIRAISKKEKENYWDIDNGTIRELDNPKDKSQPGEIENRKGLSNILDLLSYMDGYNGKLIYEKDKNQETEDWHDLYITILSDMKSDSGLEPAQADSMFRILLDKTGYDILNKLFENDKVQSEKQEQLRTLLGNNLLHWNSYHKTFEVIQRDNFSKNILAYVESIKKEEKELSIDLFCNITSKYKKYIQDNNQHNNWTNEQISKLKFLDGAKTYYDLCHIFSETVSSDNFETLQNKLTDKKDIEFQKFIRSQRSSSLFRLFKFNSVNPDDMLSFLQTLVKTRGKVSISNSSIDLINSIQPKSLNQVKLYKILECLDISVNMNEDDSRLIEMDFYAIFERLANLFNKCQNSVLKYWHLEHIWDVYIDPIICKLKKNQKLNEFNVQKLKQRVPKFLDVIQNKFGLTLIDGEDMIEIVRRESSINKNYDLDESKKRLSDQDLKELKSAEIKLITPKMFDANDNNEIKINEEKNEINLPEKNDQEITYKIYFDDNNNCVRYDMKSHFFSGLEDKLVLTQKLIEQRYDPTKKEQFILDLDWESKNLYSSFDQFYDDDYFISNLLISFIDYRTKNHITDDNKALPYDRIRNSVMGKKNTVSYWVNEYIGNIAQHLKEIRILNIDTISDKMIYELVKLKTAIKDLKITVPEKLKTEYEQKYKRMEKLYQKDKELCDANTESILKNIVRTNSEFKDGFLNNYKDNELYLGYLNHIKEAYQQYVDFVDKNKTLDTNEVKDILDYDIKIYEGFCQLSEPKAIQDKFKTISDKLNKIKGIVQNSIAQKTTVAQSNDFVKNLKNELADNDKKLQTRLEDFLGFNESCDETINEIKKQINSMNTDISPLISSFMNKELDNIDEIKKQILEAEEKTRSKLKTFLPEDDKNKDDKNELNDQFVLNYFKEIQGACKNFFGTLDIEDYSVYQDRNDSMRELKNIMSKIKDLTNKSKNTKYLNTCYAIKKSIEITRDIETKYKNADGYQDFKDAIDKLKKDGKVICNQCILHELQVYLRNRHYALENSVNGLEYVVYNNNNEITKIADTIQETQSKIDNICSKLLDMQKDNTNNNIATDAQKNLVNLRQIKNKLDSNDEKKENKDANTTKDVSNAITKTKLFMDKLQKNDTVQLIKSHREKIGQSLLEISNLMHDSMHNSNVITPEVSNQLKEVNEIQESLNMDNFSPDRIRFVNDQLSITPQAIKKINKQLEICNEQMSWLGCDFEFETNDEFTQSFKFENCYNSKTVLDNFKKMTEKNLANLEKKIKDYQTLVSNESKEDEAEDKNMNLRQNDEDKKINFFKLQQAISDFKVSKNASDNVENFKKVMIKLNNLLNSKFSLRQWKKLECKLDEFKSKTEQLKFDLNTPDIMNLIQNWFVTFQGNIDKRYNIITDNHKYEPLPKCQVSLNIGFQMRDILKNIFDLDNVKRQLSEKIEEITDDFKNDVNTDNPKTNKDKYKKRHEFIHLVINLYQVPEFRDTLDQFVKDKPYEFLRMYCDYYNPFNQDVASYEGEGISSILRRKIVPTSLVKSLIMKQPNGSIPLRILVDFAMNGYLNGQYEHKSLFLRDMIDKIQDGAFKPGIKNLNGELTSNNEEITQMLVQIITNSTIASSLSITTSQIRRLLGEGIFFSKEQIQRLFGKINDNFINRYRYSEVVFDVEKNKIDFEGDNQRQEYFQSCLIELFGDKDKNIRGLVKENEYKNENDISDLAELIIGNKITQDSQEYNNSRNFLISEIKKIVNYVEHQKNIIEKEDEIKENLPEQVQNEKVNYNFDNKENDKLQQQNNDINNKIENNNTNEVDNKITNSDPNVNINHKKGNDELQQQNNDINNNDNIKDKNSQYSDKSKYKIENNNTNKADNKITNSDPNVNTNHKIENGIDPTLLHYNDNQYKNKNSNNNPNRRITENYTTHKKTSAWKLIVGIILGITGIAGLALGFTVLALNYISLVFLAPLVLGIVLIALHFRACKIYDEYKTTVNSTNKITDEKHDSLDRNFSIDQFRQSKIDSKNDENKHNLGNNLSV